MWPFTKQNYFSRTKGLNFAVTPMIMIVVSFGVESLSANISIEGAVQAAFKNRRVTRALLTGKHKHLIIAAVLNLVLNIYIFPV